MSAMSFSGMVSGMVSSIVVLAVLVAAPSSAEAQERRGYGEWTLDLRTRWMPHLPRVTVKPGDTSDTSDSSYGTTLARTPEGTTSLGDSGVFVGGAFSYDWIVADRLKIPLFGFAGAGMVGSQPRVVGSVDGSIATARPARAGYVAFLLPGIGFRRNIRRWSFGAEARFGISFVFAPVEVSSGASSSSFTATATSLSIFGEVQACRRLDPLQRLCLFIAPSLHEFGWLNGGSAGLRWEISP